MKRLTVALSAIFLINAVPALAAFSDTAGHTFENEISYVQEQGIVNGYPDGTYGPDLPINRAEFTKIITQSAPPESPGIGVCPPDPTGIHLFSDITGSDWFWPYVCVAKARSFIDGYPDGTFGPAKNINFAEASKILVNAFDHVNPINGGIQWYEQYIEGLDDINAIPSTMLAPAQLVSRGEMAYMIHTILTSIPQDTMDTAAEAKTYRDVQLLSGKHTVVMNTSMGDITLELDADAAPRAVTNFITHAKDGYFDDLTFHRVIPDFMIQGGDPDGQGTGGESIYGESYEDEGSPIELVKGVIAMANAGPDTNGSQFFIVTAEATPWLNGKHDAFGKVTDGMDVVDAISGVSRRPNDMPNTPVTYSIQVQ